MKYPVIEPYRAYLYYPFIKLFKDDLDKFLCEYGLRVSYNKVLENLSETLDQIFLVSFVIDFDNWLKLIKEKTDDYYKAYFFNTDGSWRKDIRNKHQFIDNLAETLCSQTFVNIKECILSALGDKDLLFSTFGFLIEEKELTIELTEGDMHNGGKQPIVLSNHDTKVIYKPRVTYTEELINKVCEEIGFYSICPTIINKDRYIWQKYIEHSHVDSVEDFYKAYYNYGVIMAIMDILNVNDCHFDNFIINGYKPYLVDSETALQFYHDDITPDFERSILQTGLIQKLDSLINGSGHTSAITCTTNQLQSYTYPHAINDGTDKIQVCFEKGYVRETKNYPYCFDKPANFLNHIDDIIEGYKYGFYSLIAVSNKIIELINSLRGRIEVRFLIRRTAYYFFIIDQMLNPLVFEKFDNSKDDFIEQYFKYEDVPSSFFQLIPYELGCLINYNIPIFKIDPFNTTLFSGNGDEYPDFLPGCSFTQVRDKLQMDKKYLNRQIDIIRNNTNITFST